MSRQIVQSVKNELNIFQKSLNNAMDEIAELTNLVNELSINDNKDRGSGCSRSGMTYEYYIWEIVSHCQYDDVSYLCWQDRDELGGNSSNADLILLDHYTNEIPIEIKTKLTAPDWGQCSLKYQNNRWVVNPRSRQPVEFKNLITSTIDKINGKLFNGKVPKFCNERVTHEEWLDIKSATGDFNDMYIDCPNNMISQGYFAKSCKYVQIGDRGLYKLTQEDPCGFNVPLFQCSQRLRIRIKVHSKKTKTGYASLSVTASIQPNGHVKSSPYTLDDLDRLPRCIKYVKQ